MTPPKARAVLAWHEAPNGGDAERLVELSPPDVEVGGPRGSGRGARLLGEWALRTGIRLLPTRAFQRAETVVVEQEAGWRPSETGQLSGSQYVASVFVVGDGLVVSVSRRSDLADASRAADLDRSREVLADHEAGARGPGGGIGKL